MDRCHICNEKAVEDTALLLDGKLYPLCALHGTQAGDYLVTMLQGWLHDMRGQDVRHVMGSMPTHRPVKVPEKGKR